MTHKEPIRISRRRLLAMAGLSAGATLLSRRPLFAESEGVVPTMIHAAENAKITVHPLRRNISVLEGSGGNIAVLTGKDGKLLVDAGLAVSRPAITNALTSINADPLSTWSIPTGTWTIPTGITGCIPPERRLPLTRMFASVFRWIPA